MLAVRLGHLFHNMPGAVIITDREGRIHNMNEAARTLLGQPNNELLLNEWPRAFGLYLQDGVTPFPTENLPSTRALQGIKDVPPVDMLLRSPVDGREHRISMSAGAIFSRDGSIDGVTTLMQELPADPESMQDPVARQREGLHRFSSMLLESADDLNRIANSVAAVTADIIGDLSVVTLLEPGSTKLSMISVHESDPVTAAAFRELTTKELDYSEGENLENVVLTSGMPMLAPSSDRTEDIPSAMFGRFIDEMQIASVLMVPLMTRNTAIGAITIFRRQGGQPYSESDRTFMVDIASRTALAIENCLLFDSLQAEISARLSASQALDLSEERFQSIFEATSLGIKVLDLSGNILQTNSAFQRIIGYAEAEVVGRRFYDFLHPADMGRAVSVFQRLKRDAVSSLRFQHRAIHKNGSTIWVNAIFSAVRKGRGEQSLAFIVSILEDISEQKQVESEMLELKNRLQSMMELERLRLAHELHDGPMQDLYSVMYELEELRTKTGPDISTALIRVSDNVHQVLKELRETAKELRPPTISQFGLEKTIRSYVADLQDKHPELSMQLSLARDHQLLPEEVRLALFRVLQQSLTNIIRHAEASEVRVLFSFDAEEAQLEVTDNGKGFRVPATWIDFVREGHYGLAGAAERITALGGTFAVESQPPEVTTVRAVIPWKERMD